MTGQADASQGESRRRSPVARIAASGTSQKFSLHRTAGAPDCPCRPGAGAEPQGQTERTEQQGVDRGSVHCGPDEPDAAERQGRHEREPSRAQRLLQFAVGHPGP